MYFTELSLLGNDLVVTWGYLIRSPDQKKTCIISTKSIDIEKSIKLKGNILFIFDFKYFSNIIYDF